MMGNELPRESRPWLDQGTRVARLRPSTAVLLLGLANVYRLARDWEDGAAAASAGSADGVAMPVVLDAMGGVGTIAIEAAATARVRAITTDNDPDAVALARENVAAARRSRGALLGDVAAYEADARSLRALSAEHALVVDGGIDAIVVDMPFGKRFAALGGRKLRSTLREVRRCRRPHRQPPQQTVAHARPHTITTCNVCSTRSFFRFDARLASSITCPALPP